MGEMDNGGINCELGGISSKFRGISSELRGINSESGGISSELGGIINESLPILGISILEVIKIPKKIKKRQKFIAVLVMISLI